MMDELMATLCLGPSDTEERLINIYTSGLSTCLWCEGRCGSDVFVDTYFQGFLSPLFSLLFMSEYRL